MSMFKVVSAKQIIGTFHLSNISGSIFTSVLKFVFIHKLHIDSCSTYTFAHLLINHVDFFHRNVCLITFYSII